MCGDSLPMNANSGLELVPKGNGLLIDFSASLLSKSVFILP